MTTTTSETRKQFRARLRVAYRRGFDAQANAMVARDATPTFSNIGECRASGCEAVYAEALRDVLRLMREREVVAGSFAVTLPILTDDDLLTLAADRGLDLDQEDDK